MHARDELPAERVEVIASDAPSENLMGQVEHEEKVAPGTGDATPGGEGTSEPKKRGRGRPPKTNVGEDLSSSKGRKGKGQGSGGGGRIWGGDGIEGRGGGSGSGGRGGGGGGAPGNPGADYHGRCFIPHLISVNADEDVILRVINFSQAGPRLLCIISASGAVKEVNLRQQDGTVNMREGRFEILSLSGYFAPHQVNIDNNNNPSWAGGISVSLGDSADQVVVGEFLTGDEEGKGAGIRKHQKGKGIKFSRSVPRNLPDPASAPAPAPDAPPSPPPASATATGGYEPGFMWLGEN